MSWLKVDDKYSDSPAAQEAVGQVNHSRASDEFAASQKFNRDGDPITITEWVELLSDREYSTVGLDYVTVNGSRVLVHTLWIGHQWAGQDLFGTRVLPMGGCVDSNGQQRPVWSQSYPTLPAAAGGHAEILDGLRAGRWPS